jgi:hypothetical protein
MMPDGVDGEVVGVGKDALSQCTVPDGVDDGVDG